MAKVGGLADVVFALTKSLRNLGHRVTVALPRYPAFEQAGVLSARRLTPLPLPPINVPGLPAELAWANDKPLEAVLYDARLGSGVDVIFFDVVTPAAYGVTTLFGDVELRSTRNIYALADGLHGAFRFSVFCRAVVEYLKVRSRPNGLRAGEAAYDVVHAHDWPTAMVPYLTRESEELLGVRTALTIHDAGAQGQFAGAAAKTVLGLFGLGTDHFTMDRLEFYGGVNLLKGGIARADLVTTVSSTYATELLSEGGGYRLAGVLAARRAPIVGIRNGVDYSVWNPATDPALVARYDADEASNRGRSKTTLLADLGLPLDPEIPLFVSLGRVTEPKGADILAAAVRRLAKQDLTLVVAGQGDAGIEAALSATAADHSDRVRYLGFADEKVAHRLMAAADFVLMPSRREPCGLVQMHAQRYGAVPVVTRTGGLVDTVVDCDADLETGTGIAFGGPSVEELASAVGRAVSAFRHPRFPSLRRRIMRLDVGWERPARLYAQAYTKLLA